MQRCPVCSGRTIKTDTGARCMNSSCEGTAQLSAEAGVACHCGEMMIYSGLNSYGEPNYVCTACGSRTKL